MNEPSTNFSPMKQKKIRQKCAPITKRENLPPKPPPTTGANRMGSKRERERERERAARLPHPVSPTMSVTRFPFTFSTIFPRSASTASGARASPTRFSSAIAMLSGLRPPPTARGDGDGGRCGCGCLLLQAFALLLLASRPLPLLSFFEGEVRWLLLLGRRPGAWTRAHRSVYGWWGPVGGAPTPGPRLHAIPTRGAPLSRVAAGDKTVFRMGESLALVSQPHE